MVGLEHEVLAVPVGAVGEGRHVRAVVLAHHGRVFYEHLARLAALARTIPLQTHEKLFAVGNGASYTGELIRRRAQFHALEQFAPTSSRRSSVGSSLGCKGNCGSKEADIKPHDLRRTFGTWFLQANPGHVRELAELMGHSDLS
jgi:site-specific recombinase XerC